jgi:hypothetical protein
MNLRDLAEDAIGLEFINTLPHWGIAARLADFLRWGRVCWGSICRVFSELKSYVRSHTTPKKSAVYR